MAARSARGTPLRLGLVGESDGVEICHLLDHPSLARALGENARHAVVSRFSWGDAARQTEEVYERVLAAR